MAVEEIIELTQIVKTGHAPAQTAEMSASAAVAAAPASDFGADLDALLKSYDSQPASTEATPEAIADDATQLEAAPSSISAQDGHKHVVDPNEALDLPPLSDLDALLEQLGVQNDSGAAPSASPTLKLGDDLDVLSAPGKSDIPPAVPEIVASGSEPAKAVVIAPAAAQAGAAAPHAAQQAEGIDLNELDVLLDSVLASAPKAVPAKAASANVSAAAHAASGLPADADIESLHGEIAALKAELSDLRNNMDKYAAAAAAKVIREEMANLLRYLE